MLEKGLVKDVADLYRLSKEDILELDGFAPKSAGQLHEAIQNAKELPLDRFLYALGIRHVGQRAARILALSFGTLEAVQEAKGGHLENIPEIGPEIARSVVEFFNRKENQHVLERLADAEVKVQDMPNSKKDQPLEGKTFVFTGKLEGYTRQEAERLVEDLGGRATSGLSKETDYVVVGDEPGGKYDDAMDLDVPILSEEEFRKLVS
jgi:DNA ligase (NAD+)